MDVILTNPPFGGEEEPGIQNNFPADKRTSETALLFLQLIMRRLRRQPESQGITLVALTGWGQEEDRRRTRDAGFDQHLVKPAETSELAKLLAESRPSDP